MAGETILDLMTRVNVEPLKSAMTEASSAVSTSVGKMKADFSSVAASSVAANQGVETMMSKLPPAFIKVEAGGVFAFEQIKRRVVEATSEVGALRQEILSTNDSAKLNELNAQLDQARARMTAARTELRAMRLEMNDTREKADLLGESLGVKIPGSLGRLLGQIPLLQTAMNAAFAPIMVLFFADAVMNVVEWIERATESLAGYTEEVKKSVEEAKKANEEQIRHAGSVREATEKIIETNRRLGEVGKSSFASFEESARKAKEETSGLLDALTYGAVSAYRSIKHLTTDAANETVLLNERLREQLRARMEVGAAEDRAALKSREQFAAAEQVGKSRIAQIREEIRALNEKQALETRIAAEEASSKKGGDAADVARARADVEAGFAAKRLELQRQLAEQFASVSIAAAKSEVAARQAIETAYINFYESGLQQMYAAGQITLADELAGEKAAAEQRLAIRLNEIQQQKSLALREQAATGKDATPEVIALDEKRVTAEIQTQQKLNELEARGAQETLRMRNEVNLATVQAAKSTADSEIAVVEESAKRRFANGQIVLEELTAIEKAAANQRIDGQRSALQEQLRIANEFPEKNKAAIVTLNSELANLERQRVKEIEAIDLDAENHKRQVLAIEAEGARAHQQTLLQIERLGIDTRASLGLISGQQRLAQLQAITTEEYQLERQAIERKKALYALGTAQYEQAEKELQQINDKYDKQMAEDDAAALKARFAAWTKFDRQISDGFATAVGEMLRGEKTFGQALTGVWNSMVVDFAQMLTRRLVDWTLQHTAMRVISNIFHLQELTQQTVTRTAETAADTTAQTATVARHTAANAVMAASDATYTIEYVAAATTRTAGEAAAETTAGSFHAATDVAEVISSAAVGAASAAAAAAPGGPAAMAAAAAAAEAMILSFAPQAAVFAARGAVLDSDSLVQAHAREMILPPHISVGLQDLISSGGLSDLHRPMAALHGGAATGAQGGDRPSIGSSPGATHTHIHTHRHTWNNTINGAKGDLGETLDRELVPRIKKAIRQGYLRQ